MSGILRRCLLVRGAVLLLLPAAAAAEPVWVFFTDKADAAGQVLSWPAPRHVRPDPGLDIDLDRRYTAAVESLGLPIRARSRWFNAVSVDAGPGQAARLRRLSFVREVRPVRAWLRPSPALPVEPPPGRPAPRPAALDYGPSLEQLAAVNVPLLHDRGLLGQGVRVALIDAGFNWTAHAAFAGLRVLAVRDFINGDDEVGDEPAQPVTGQEAAHGQNVHGTRVLGVIAGHEPGQLIGVAPAAGYLLAKTEDVSPSAGGGESELPIEEDRWVAAIEWADSLGAQVVNASVGYTRFEDGTGYTWEDLDGATALTTKAAELAVARGIVVVAAAGNEALGDWHYVTVPADGPGVIAVGSVHPWTDELAPTSSRGPTADGRIKPDLVAPGQAVFTVSGRGAGKGAESFSLREYSHVSGTSFAAPIAAGVCALLLQEHPRWTPGEVASALRSTAVDLGPAGPDTLFGWGRIDAARATGLEVPGPLASAALDPFPNPARGSSPSIHFPVDLSGAETLSLRLFDAAGALVHVMDRRRLPAGTYHLPGLALSWEVGADLASGVYFYRVEGDSFRRAGKVAVLRGL